MRWTLRVLSDSPSSSSSVLTIKPSTTTPLFLSKDVCFGELTSVSWPGVTSFSVTWTEALLWLNGDSLKLVCWHLERFRGVPDLSVLQLVPLEIKRQLQLLPDWDALLALFNISIIGGLDEHDGEVILSGESFGGNNGGSGWAIVGSEGFMFLK